MAQGSLSPGHASASVEGQGVQDAVALGAPFVLASVGKVQTAAQLRDEHCPKAPLSLLTD